MFKRFLVVALFSVPHLSYAADTAKELIYGLKRDEVSQWDLALFRLSLALSDINKITKERFNTDKYSMVFSYTPKSDGTGIYINMDATGPTSEMSKDACNKAINDFSAKLASKDVLASIAFPDLPNSKALKNIFTYRLTLISSDNNDLQITCLK